MSSSLFVKRSCTDARMPGIIRKIGDNIVRESGSQNMNLYEKHLSYFFFQV
jgi:hypothetical protein